jgi:hypothetical protein
MARARARAARGDTLAGEAWEAGCRDVQAAINWAAGKGEVAGPPFQAAFRRLLKAHDAGPPPATAVDPGTGLTGGRAKHGRQGGHRRAEPDRAAVGGAGKRSARPKPEGNGQAVDEPAPVSAPSRGTGTAAGPKPGTPAEFVEDMRTLRHLVAKYGKKGLADLIGMLAG